MTYAGFSAVIVYRPAGKSGNANLPLSSVVTCTFPVTAEPDSVTSTRRSGRAVSSWLVTMPPMSAVPGLALQRGRITRLLSLRGR